MIKRPTSAHDQEKPQRPSRSRRQGKGVLIKTDNKKSARQKATRTTTVAIAEPLLENPSANGDVQARVAERAYELYHRRGGHHGQDLDDWFAAEREVLLPQES